MSHSSSSCIPTVLPTSCDVAATASSHCPLRHTGTNKPVFVPVGHSVVCKKTEGRLNTTGRKTDGDSGEMTRTKEYRRCGLIVEEAKFFHCSFAAGDTHSSPVQSSCACEMPKQSSHSDDCPIIFVKWKRFGRGETEWKTDKGGSLLSISKEKRKYITEKKVLFDIIVLL